MIRKGFTLIELLAVITILALITAIAVPLVTSAINNSNEKIVLESAKELIKAAATDVVDKGYSVPYQYKVEDNSLDYQAGDFTKGLIVVTNGNHSFVENLSTPKYCINGPLDDLNITEGVCTNTDYNTYKSIQDIQNQMKTEANLLFDDFREDFYLKGNVNNNYVSYSGRTWRIVSFQDGMVKLVSQGTDTEAGSKNYQEALNYLNGTFYNNLTSKDYVSEVSYGTGNVTDITASSDANNVLAAEETNHHEYKVGLLSAGEFLRANDGSSNFLANGTTWLLTTKNASSGYYLTNRTISSAVLTTSKTVRPVIMLKDYIVFTGTGTSSDPYVVK